MPLPNALGVAFPVQSIMRSPATLHSGSPNKRNSEIGFAKENAAGIPMMPLSVTIKILITSLSWFSPYPFPRDERVS